MKTYQVNIEDLNETLTVKRGINSIKVFHGDTELKRSGVFTQTYSALINGVQESFKLRQDLSLNIILKYRDKEYPLERKLTTVENIMALIPLVLVFLGGAIGGIIGAFGAYFLASKFRTLNSMSAKVLWTVAVTVIVLLVYLLLAGIFGTLIHGIIY